MSETTGGLPLMAQTQNSRYLTFNELSWALNVLQTGVLDRDLTTPPGSPSEGDAYIVDSPATGAWAGHENDITFFFDGIWNFLDPELAQGNGIYVADEGYRVRWNIGSPSGYEVLTVGSDASTVTYTPAVPADWDGSADPGDASDAFDQLAERVKDLEGVSGGIGGSTGATDNRVLRADGTGGSTLQSSGVTIDDSNNVTGIAALGATTIELGHASDTTLTRVSAGVVAIEGQNILTAATGQPLDSDLTTIAGLTATTDNFIQAKSSAWASRTPTQVAADLSSLIKPVEFIAIACSDETTALTTGTAKATFRMPYAFTLTDVRASVTTAPTGASLLTVDVNESGTTILSTKLTFDASEKTTTTAATPRVISDSSLADDAEITVDIDQIGSTIAGAGLKVYLIGTRT